MSTTKRNNEDNRSIQLTIAFDVEVEEDRKASDHRNDKHETGDFPGASAKSREAVPQQATPPLLARESSQPIDGKESKKKKWYSLADKMYNPANLRLAWDKVAANDGAAGIDGMSIDKFAQDSEARLDALQADLQAKTYRPQPVKRVLIPKTGGGERPLGIPTVRDRIVQQALLQVLLPVFEPGFSDRSHGYRPERGCETCLNVVDQAIRHGYSWVVDADIKGFFDNMDHDILMQLIREEIADGTVLNLIEAILEAGVIEPNVSELEPTELGTSQGSPLSPLLANIYLNQLDQKMQDKYGLIRYADDFVIFARSKGEAEQALADAREILEGELKLTLHPEKTRIVTVDSGFEFLGFHYFRISKGVMIKTVRRSSCQKFRDNVRKRTPRIKNQKKPKARNFRKKDLEKNLRLKPIVAKLNRFLRSWYGYFKASAVPASTGLRWADKIVRRRLRQSLTGRVGNGWWNQVITNNMLHQTGLVSLHDLYIHDAGANRLRTVNRKV